jgi:methyl coenzyme M reductase gamma subunit
MTLKAQIVELEKKYDLAILEKKYQYEIELEKLRSGSKVDVAKVYNDREPNTAPINLGNPMLPESLDMQNQMMQQMMQQQNPMPSN